jgi:hypothetical protein
MVIQNRQRQDLLAKYNHTGSQSLTPNMGDEYRLMLSRYLKARRKRKGKMKPQQGWHNLELLER